MNIKNYFIFSTFLLQYAVFGQNYSVSEKQFAPELIGNHYKNDKKTKTVVLIIAGSGPTDRNGNSTMAENNSLKFLAEGLAQSNYDVITYDKRVVHLVKNFKGDNKDFPEIDFQHGIDDAKTIIQYLNDQLKYQNVVVIGHSEGSLVGMNAANQTAKAYVSIAGAGRSIDLILKEQIGKQAPFLNEATEKILDELKKGNKVTDVNPMLQSVFSANNQPFIIDWVKHDPQKDIKALNIPVLIINGTKDLQIEKKEAEFLKTAKPDAQLVIIENMNHVLKEIKDDEYKIKSYNDPDAPLHTELVPVITQFLKANKL